MSKFELWQRDGHGKDKVADAETLAEIASISAEMSGTDPDELFLFGDDDD